VALAFHKGEPAIPAPPYLQPVSAKAVAQTASNIGMSQDHEPIMTLI